VTKRADPDPDNILLARIAGTAARHARGGDPLTPEQEAEAIRELRELAGRRPDLLAQHAGLRLGRGETRQTPRDRLEADLCLKAGADPAIIAEWITIGRIRERESSGIPYTGIMRRRSPDEIP
jgi:hypothetical protein